MDVGQFLLLFLLLGFGVGGRACANFLAPTVSTQSPHYDNIFVLGPLSIAEPLHLAASTPSSLCHPILKEQQFAWINLPYSNSPSTTTSKRVRLPARVLCGNCSCEGIDQASSRERTPRILFRLGAFLGQPACIHQVVVFRGPSRHKDLRQQISCVGYRSPKGPSTQIQSTFPNSLLQFLV